MSTQETENLIDLSAEFNNSIRVTTPAERNNEVLLSVNSINGRDSLENNPFDKVLKEVDLLNDPFECVFQEAEKYSKIVNVEVKVGDLLSLPDVSNKDVQKINTEDKVNNELNIPHFSRIGSNNSNQLSSISSLSSLYSPSSLDKAFMLESPLLNSVDSNENSTLNRAFITENTILSESNNDSSNVLNKGFINSSSSPQQTNEQVLCEKSDTGLENVLGSADAERSSLKDVPEKELSLKKNTSSLLKLSLVNSTISPLRSSECSTNSDQSVFTEASHLAEKLSRMIVVDSSKEDSCDDLMAINPNWEDSEADLDSDLEMLKIPILEEINQAKPPVIPVEFEAVRNTQENNCPLDKDIDSSALKVPSRRSLDLNALKERIELQRQRKDENIPDVNALIESLKKIVFECSNDDKKAEASILLESLSNMLANQNKGQIETSHPPTPPQLVVRQGTFDLDKSSPKENLKQCEAEAAVTSRSLSPSTTVHSPENSSPRIQTTVPEIVEQISKLFGNENVNVVQTNLGPASVNSNPTYIVVMGTPAPLVRQSTQIYSREGDGSPEFSNAQHRKRSNSLSLHDKSVRIQRERTRTSPLKDCKTPRPRKSLGNTPARPNLNNVRRSIGDFNKKTPGKQNPQYSTKRPALETHHEVDTPPITIKITKPEIIPKKLKFKSTEAAPKTRGPLKAVIPVKKVAPMLVTSSVSSPIEDNGKKKPLTSTPVIVVSSEEMVPNACSTPTVDQVEVSPGKNALKGRTRYSYVSATPKPKSNAPNVSILRRRSLTDLKTPKRCVDSMKEVGIGKAQVKTIKLPQDFIKTVNKIGSVKVSKPLKRDSLLEKNKENKLPRALK